MRRALLMALITALVTSAVVTPEQNHQIWRVMGPAVDAVVGVFSAEEEAPEGKANEITSRRLGDHMLPPTLHLPSGAAMRVSGTPVQLLCLRRLLNQRETDERLRAAPQDMKMDLTVQNCS